MCYVRRCGVVPPGLWYHLVRFACLASLLTRDYSQVSRRIGTYLRRRLGFPARSASVTADLAAHPPPSGRALEQSVELGVDFVGD